MKRNGTKPFLILITLATIAVISGCHHQVASKPAAAQPPQPAPAPAPPVVAQSAPAKAPPAAAQSTAPSESLDQLFRQNVKDAFFAYDKSDLTAEDRQALLSDAEFLRAHPEVKFTLEGHCDERGSEEYNLGLGDRRASSAKKFLVDAGITDSRVQTTSYGKEHPFCTEHDEACWKENRRAHTVMEQ